MKYGAQDMVQLLRIRAIFVEDLSSILSTYISDLELPITLRVPALICVSTHTKLNL